MNLESYVLRTIIGLLDAIVIIAWGLSMMAFPTGFLIMIFGGGSAVFVNSAIVVAITTTLLWAVRSAKS